MNVNNVKHPVINPEINSGQKTIKRIIPSIVITFGFYQLNI